MQIYGSSCNSWVLQAAGILVKGFAPSLDIMQQYRVCLAPLRFGAGLKGKIVDSWAHGLPVCTTPVGAEGMFPATSQTPEGFPDTQVRLSAWHGSCVIVRQPLMVARNSGNQWANILALQVLRVSWS